MTTASASADLPRDTEPVVAERRPDPGHPYRWWCVYCERPLRLGDEGLVDDEHGLLWCIEDPIPGLGLLPGDRCWHFDVPIEWKDSWQFSIPRRTR